VTGHPSSLVAPWMQDPAAGSWQGAVVTGETVGAVQTVGRGSITRMAEQAADQPWAVVVVDDRRFDAADRASIVLLRVERCPDVGRRRATDRRRVKADACPGAGPVELVR
jgi:hypothetical protein